jgi:hypothetical protein
MADIMLKLAGIVLVLLFICLGVSMFWMKGEANKVACDACLVDNNLTYFDLCNEPRCHKAVDTLFDQCYRQCIVGVNP